MKKKYLSLIGIVTYLGLVSSLTGCSSNEEKTILRVLNLEDYIYINEDEDGTPEEEQTPPDLTIQFEEYARELGYDVEVVYDTTDTNETMYSEMQTGKSNYDLICTSDYMLQKVVSNGLADKLDMSLIPNYSTYASRVVKGRLDEIETTIKSTNEVVKLEEYSVGYMWGTLGMLFNPTYEEYTAKGLDEETIINDMDDWHILWENDDKYNGTFSIKDSMRDTYAVGLMEHNKEYLIDLYNKHENSEITDDEYNEQLSYYFNLCDEDTIDAVTETLQELKENAFGLECDSGKQDIVTGKIGINIAWSGDAVYSMDQAEDEEQVTEPFELWYSVPKYGSNIWFDGWFMPHCERTVEQYELAHMFLDFICDPVNVAQNMDYTGYTSFIGGDSILELTRDWYDLRTSYMYADEEFEVYYVDPTTEEEVLVDYDTFFLSPIESNPALYYYDENEETCDFINPDDEETVMHFNDLLEVLNDAEQVDLSYFFGETLEEYTDSDMIFYSDCYLPISYENGDTNIAVGRQFFCQFPDQATMNRCAVMRDYGDIGNELIMKMWENFKSDPLPGWAIALFVLEGAAIVGLMVYFIVNKKIKLNNRKRRKELENQK